GAIVQSTAAYVPLNPDGSLPSPATDNNFTIAGDGTYGSIVIPSNHLGILAWDGSAWSKVEEVEMPTVEGTDELIEQEIPKGKAIFSYLDGLLIGNAMKLQTSLTAGTFNATTGVLNTSVNWIRTEYVNCEPETEYI